jgi:hypothetical protein
VKLLNFKYPDPADPNASEDMQDRYKKHIWTDVNGVLHKVTVLTDAHLQNIIKLIQKDPDEIINGYKAKDWLPMMLAEYAVRINKIAQSTVTAPQICELEPFPATWTHFEPNMIRPNDREYNTPPLVEYSETIYGKYHCVVELKHDGYRVGYVGVRKNHPAYRKGIDDISTLVHGGLSHTTHQVATFRVPYISMWYFAIRFNHEEDYPDINALEKYIAYWQGTEAYHSIDDMIKQSSIEPTLLKGGGLFEVRDLDFVKEQLVQLVLDLEQYEKDKNKATINVAPF